MLFVNVDASELEDVLGIDEAADSAMAKATADLAAATHAKLAELASERLHTRRKTYLDALDIFQADDGIWVVNLDASATWVENGLSAHSMLEDLLKSKSAKRAADGSTYVSIPFQHNRGKQEMTPAQQKLTDTIKKELSKVGAGLNKLENDSSGKPKLGLVRSLDIEKAPISTGALKIGNGPRGQVAQGATGGIPLLRGVRVYQREVKGKDGEQKVGRFVMTFRTASSKMKGGGKWQHPGLAPMNLMEEATEWALQQWSKVAQDIVNRITVEISG